MNIFSHEKDDFDKMSALPTKGKQLTKDEVALLINLIESNEVITIKPTNAKINHEKALAWAKVTDTFNAVISTEPRKQDQLRLKWENLKKSARRRAMMIKRKNAQVTDNQGVFVRRDCALDRVIAMLETKSSRRLNEVKYEPEVVLGIEGSRKTSTDSTSSRSDDVESNDFGVHSDFADKRHLLEDVKARIARDQAIANYYALKSRKVELEIERMRLHNDKLKLLKQNDN